MDYGRAYVYNLLTFPLELTLNGGARRVIPPLSDGEPFTPRLLTAPRSFEPSQPADLFGRQNVLRYGPVGGAAASVTLTVDPEVWPVNEPVQVYLLANLTVLRVGMDGQRATPTPAFSEGTATTKTQRAFFFNMTGQSLRLVLNDGTPVTLPAISGAEPFTPPLTPFPRVDVTQPSQQAVFGVTNSVQYWLAGSSLAAAKRRVTLQVKTSDWALANDVQVYLFQRSAVVRLGGKATYATTTVG
ncbi:hypothetical protein A176_005258 [Myxococcus hansupus]|uniref:Uncharacterized protein n=1 Tax=Pseudomyxococcus hansupus TaxID=1297742 RepID=A0A0H4WY56_9BACT|nr:hypothetical protein [Myxococcus hansupus]AKQ68346.1 hypothetical protein A176_005258 [Myxococcus hansupus]